MQNFHARDIQKLESYLNIKSEAGKYEDILWKKVRKYQFLFSKIPGILGVAVCNSLAMNACHAHSDIDLFIITRSKRLWTSRMILTLILTLLGQRKTSRKHAGKFCLSFFISENAMDFSTIAIQNDIYLSYWMQTLRPIVEKEKIFERFMEKNFLLNSLSFQEKEATKKKKMQPLTLQKEKDSGWSCIFGNAIESLLKKIFLPRTQKSFQKLGKPFGVIITDDMLKFHDKDRRREISQKIFPS